MPDGTAARCLGSDDIHWDSPEGAPPLWNDRAATVPRGAEKPEHRTMAYMKAQGKSNREIARIMNMTESNVSIVLRQPYARRLITDEISRAGRNNIQSILEASVEDSLYKLIELRDSAPPSVSLNASNSILDRFLGKPVQRTENVNANVAVGNLEEVDAEIRRLEREEAALLHKRYDDDEEKGPLSTPQ